jgi:hypothetical protein
MQICRPIDGVDQTDVQLGTREVGNRDKRPERHRAGLPHRFGTLLEWGIA